MCALITRTSCAVGMRNAKLWNHPNDMPVNKRVFFAKSTIYIFLCGSVYVRYFHVQLRKIIIIYCLCTKSDWHPFFFHFSLLVINCTSLRVDPGGPLRMSSCDNHYGAHCNFSCAIGYRLNGSSTVTCVAPGNQHPGVWSNTTPRCEGKPENQTTYGNSLY